MQRNIFGVLLAIAILTLVVYIVHFEQKAPQHIDENKTDYFEMQKHWIDQFKEIGSITDKVTSHGYQYLYGFLLGPRKQKSLKILEIGLGCDMYYGPGRSLITWRAYLPKATICILEYNRNCAEKFNDKVDKLFIGDQADFALLKNVSQSGPYDLIIDDGGHTRKQQVNSFLGLWESLNSEGIYVIEDLFANFRSEYKDSNISAFDLLVNILYHLAKASGDIEMKHLEVIDGLAKITNEIRSMHCFWKICAFIKK